MSAHFEFVRAALQGAKASVSGIDAAIEQLEGQRAQVLADLRSQRAKVMSELDAAAREAEDALDQAKDEAVRALLASVEVDALLGPMALAALRDGLGAAGLSRQAAVGVVAEVLKGFGPQALLAARSLPNLPAAQRVDAATAEHAVLGRHHADALGVGSPEIAAAKLAAAEVQSLRIESLTLLGGGTAPDAVERARASWLDFIEQTGEDEEKHARDTNIARGIPVRPLGAWRQ